MAEDLPDLSLEEPPAPEVPEVVPVEAAPLVPEQTGPSLKLSLSKFGLLSGVGTLLSVGMVFLRAKRRQKTARQEAEHISKDGLRLYMVESCPFCQRVMIALHEKEIGFDTAIVDVYKKEEWFLKLNPLGTVPVLAHQGSVVYESLVCLEYLDEAFPSNSPLFPPPSQPHARALHRQILHFITERLIPSFFHALKSETAEEISTNMALLVKWLRYLNVQLANNSPDGPYFFGAQFSAVDIVLYTFFVRIVVVLGHFRQFSLQKSGDLDRLQQWFQEVKQRPSVQASMSMEDQQKMIDSFAKYLHMFPHRHLSAGMKIQW